MFSSIYQYSSCLLNGLTTLSGSDDSIHLCKIALPSQTMCASYSSSTLPSVTHSLTINSDLSWMAFVHGHPVSSSRCVPLSSIPDKLDHDSLKLLLSKLDSSRVCPGHPDHNFEEMFLSKKGKIMSKNSKDVVASIDSSAPVHLNGDNYTQTVRKSTCEILTNDTKCGQCVNYRDTLRKSFHRWKKGKESPN